MAYQHRAVTQIMDITDGGTGYRTSDVVYSSEVPPKKATFTCVWVGHAVVGAYIIVQGRSDSSFAWEALKYMTSEAIATTAIPGEDGIVFDGNTTFYAQVEALPEMRVLARHGGQGADKVIKMWASA